MHPIFGDRDYLEEQHILIAIRTRDGDHESYGELSKFSIMSLGLVPDQLILINSHNYTSDL